MNTLDLLLSSSSFFEESRPVVVYICDDASAGLANAEIESTLFHEIMRFMLLDCQ